MARRVHRGRASVAQLRHGADAVDDANPGLYGSGYINGTIIGIPKNGKHQDEAWDLVKYLTTNTHALAELSNGLRNVPVDDGSLDSKELKPDAHFATFLKIFGEPALDHVADHRGRAAYPNTVPELRDKWQAGQVEGPAVRAPELDKQLDAMVKQAKGGGVP